MKQLQLLFLITMISFSLANEISAQDGFPVLLTYNTVILIDYNENHDPDVKSEMIKLFKELRKKVDGCEWVHVGELAASSQGFDQAITLTFTSKASFEKYELHDDYNLIKTLASDITTAFERYEYWEKLE